MSAMRQRQNKAPPAPSLSLCMIVKNEEKFLENFIRLHASLFDDWAIVDTGSTDATPDIIRDARLPFYRYEWNDDFAAARNYSLSLCKGKWVASMDADEILDPFTQQQLRHFMLKPEIDSIEIDIKNYISEKNMVAHCGEYLMEYHAPDGSYQSAISNSIEDYGYRMTRLVRFFRNGIGFHWESPVHEVLIRPDTSKGKGCHIEGICLHHLGMLDRDGKADAKQQMYRRIAAGIKEGIKLEEHPKALFEASRFVQDLSEKAKLLDRALVKAPKDITILKEMTNTRLKMKDTSAALATALQMTEHHPSLLEGYLAAARCYSEGGETDAAVRFLKKQMSCFRNNAMYNYTLATLHMQARQFIEAASYAFRAAELSPASTMMSELKEKLRKIKEMTGPHV